jgi:hypothetical protein
MYNIVSLALVRLLVKTAQGRQARPALHQQFRSCPHSQGLQPGRCELIGDRFRAQSVFISRDDKEEKLLNHTGKDNNRQRS